jgi:hypothetical protein
VGDGVRGVLLESWFLGGLGSRATPRTKEASTEPQSNVATSFASLRGQNRTLEGVITLDCNEWGKTLPLTRNILVNIGPTLAQLSQGFPLDLSHSLSTNVQTFSHSGKGQRLSVIEAKAKV